MDFKEVDDRRKVKKINLTSHLTDTGNAEKINEMYGNQVRFDHRRRRWLIWQGHRWQPDTDGSVNRLAINAAKKRYQEATEIKDLGHRTLVSKWSIASEAKSRLDAATGIVKTLLPIADSGDNWDQETMLLSCPNGIVDLTTGLLRDGKPEDRITMTTGVVFDSNAKCPRWIQFLDEVFEKDEDVKHYVHKALGYTITGSQIEQAVFFGHGPGSNGKSVFFSTIRKVLGDYSYNAPASLFQRNVQNTASNDLAATEFKRFLMCSEVLSSAKLNEQRLKQISGGDPVTARYLYSENFTFLPVAKIWLFINHLPAVEDDSYGFWRRVKLIPFKRIFSPKEQDNKLTLKLEAELPGLLNWLVQGCLVWQKEGLNAVPEIIRLATKDYQVENDALAEFLFDFMSLNNADEVQALEIYRAYTEWAEKQGLKGKDILTNTAFGRRMSDKFTKHSSNGRAYYRGLGHLVAGSEQNSRMSSELILNFSKPSIYNSYEDSLVKTTTNPLPRHANPLQPPTVVQADEQDSCYLCNGTSFYKNPSGVWTCDRCHPPIMEAKE